MGTSKRLMPHALPSPRRGGCAPQVLNWHATDEVLEEDGDGDGDGDEDDEQEDGRSMLGKLRYVLRAFGVTAHGESVCLRIDGFTPYFFVKVPVDLARSPRRSLAIRALEEQLRRMFGLLDDGGGSSGSSSGWGRKDDDKNKNKGKSGKGKSGCRSVQTVRRKDFLGFTDGEDFDFVRLTFHSRRAMQFAAAKLRHPVTVRSLGNAALRLALYESNIDPMLRFLHVQGLQPVGWLHVAARDLKAPSPSPSPPPCQVSARVDWKKGVPSPCSPGAGTPLMAPFLIAAFDIECNSAHGDFPVASKDYRRLAIDLQQAWEAQALHDKGRYAARAQVGARMRGAFFGLSDDGVEVLGIPPPRLAFKAGPRPFAAPAVRQEVEAVIDELVDEVYTALVNGSAAGPKPKPNSAAATAAAAAKKKTSPAPKGASKASNASPAPKGAKASGASRASPFTRVNTAAAAAAVASAATAASSSSDEDDGEGGGGAGASAVDRILSTLDAAFAARWPLCGDEVIQIGMTYGIYGDADTVCCERHVLVLGTCDAVPGATVRCFEREVDLLLAWTQLVRDTDPDVVLGYNIFGFDFAYLFDRANELLLGRVADLSEREARDRRLPAPLERFCRLGRIPGMPSTFGDAFIEQQLSSSALGDNVLRYLHMHGRVVVDVMNVVRRDHRLDSYKLDAVAEHFTGQRKHDVSPNDVFRMQRGGPADRAVIAAYCVQDCELCNVLAAKLELLANNMGMANVCSVPLSFIFMRGQGVKILSLVAKFCRADDFVVPAFLQKPAREGEVASEEDEDAYGYEGAIVLPPQTGMYLEDPVAVLDYNSLYPSSMISHNLSHDSLVLDPAYDGLPGVQYTEVTYDSQGPSKSAVVCRYGRRAGAPEAVLPRILRDLLAERKLTRKRMEYVRVGDLVGLLSLSPLAPPDAQVQEQEHTHVLTDDAGATHALTAAAAATAEPAYSAFEQAVMDGLQLALKVTSNSLYGQTGARTSPLYLKHIAACTTAVGRQMILLAKEYVESACGGKVIYGDTDSIFITFDNRDADGARLTGRAALAQSIAKAQQVSVGVHALLPPPQRLAYEKTFFPFLLLSKKRYVGLQYGESADAKPKQKSMGIALKRRDYAPIVKTVYGGLIDIVLTDRDVPRGVRFLKQKLADLAAGVYDLEDLVISKTLRSYYKFPHQIAHWVLTQRMFARDPGSAPQVNDRIPYVFVEAADPRALMGDRIEHIQYVRDALARSQAASIAETAAAAAAAAAAGPKTRSSSKQVKPKPPPKPPKVRVDVMLYVRKQIMKPCTQLLAIALEQVPGYRRDDSLSGPQALSKLVALYGGDEQKARTALNTKRERAVEHMIFEPIFREHANRMGNQPEIDTFFRPAAAAAASTASNASNPWPDEDQEDDGDD
jgi:DNA polymerase elongation subunit (family B)